MISVVVHLAAERLRAGEIVGLLEWVESGAVQPFTSLDELTTSLVDEPGSTHGRG